jgi:hypothetical protein
MSKLSVEILGQALILSTLGRNHTSMVLMIRTSQYLSRVGEFTNPCRWLMHNRSCGLTSRTLEAGATYACESSLFFVQGRNLLS